MAQSARPRDMDITKGRPRPSKRRRAHRRVEHHDDHQQHHHGGRGEPGLEVLFPRHRGDLPDSGWLENGATIRRARKESFGGLAIPVGPMTLRPGFAAGLPFRAVLFTRYRAVSNLACAPRVSKSLGATQFIQSGYKLGTDRKRLANRPRTSPADPARTAGGMGGSSALARRLYQASCRRHPTHKITAHTPLAAIK